MATRRWVHALASRVDTEPGTATGADTLANNGATSANSSRSSSGSPICSIISSVFAVFLFLLQFCHAEDARCASGCLCSDGDLELLAESAIEREEWRTIRAFDRCSTPETHLRTPTAPNQTQHICLESTRRN